MLRVGLTGGIGSGKSEVSRRLAALGAVIIDADVAARRVVDPGTPGLARIAETFGPGVLRPDGALDRERLGAIVFSDPAQLAKLNAITHPLIGEWMQAAERAVTEAVRRQPDRRLRRGAAGRVGPLGQLRPGHRGGRPARAPGRPPSRPARHVSRPSPSPPGRPGHPRTAPRPSGPGHRQLRLTRGPRPSRRRGLVRPQPPRRRPLTRPPAADAGSAQPDSVLERVQARGREPRHREQGPFVGRPVQPVAAALGEGDPRSGHQILDRPRDQDLRGPRERSDPIGDLHRGPSDVLPDQVDLPGMDPGPDLDPGRGRVRRGPRPHTGSPAQAHQR